MEDFSAKGEFWLPETPDLRVSGWVEFKRGEGAQLHLIGRLGGFGLSGSAVPRIFGECSAGALTLDNCFQTRSQIAMSGPGEQTYRVGMIFVGQFYFAKDEVPQFDQLSVRLRHLREWVGRSGLDEDRIYDDEGKFLGWKLSVQGLSVLEADVDSSAKIKLHHGTGITGADSARTLTQQETIQFELDAPRVLREVTVYAALMQDLVSIATHRVAEFDAFKLSQPDFVTTHEDGLVSMEWVDLHLEWIAQEKSDKGISVAVRFDTLGGVEGLAAWLRTAIQFKPFVTRVMATRYSKMYTDDRFFNRVAALEGLHRQLTGKKKFALAMRLKELADMAGDPFLRLVNNVDDWIQQVTAERNNHAHQLGNAAQATGASRYYLAESVYWLFVMCLFRQCGYSDAVFKELESFDEVRWVRDRLTEL